MDAIELGTARAQSGRKAWGQLTVRQRHKQVRLPVAVVHGAKPGPHAVLLANQHGLELNGVEAIRCVVEELNPEAIRGTVFAVPSMNPRAAMLADQCWPEEHHARLVRSFGAGPYRNVKGDYRSPYNMNWLWPGRRAGSLVERIIWEVWNRAVIAPHRRADLVVDLHCHQSRTAVYAEDDVATDLGVATGIAYIVKTRFPDKMKITSNNSACRRVGIPSLTIELSGQRAIFPQSVDQGRAALLNLLKFLGVLRGKPVLPEGTYVLDPWRDKFSDKKYARPSNVMHFARKPGLMVPHKQMYDVVKKGDLICEVVNPYTGQIVESGRAGMSGMIYGMHLSGVCGPGDRLFVVATVRVAS